MKHMIILLTVTLTTLCAYGIGQKMLADHSHTDITPAHTGMFDLGHSGGLDKNGGHYDRSTGTYHYHR